MFIVIYFVVSVFSEFDVIFTYVLLYQLLQGDFSPRPVDLRNVTLTRGMLEMAEKVAENCHETWAKKKMADLIAIG